MTKIRTLFACLTSLFLLFLVSSCQNDSTQSASTDEKFTVKVRLPGEPDGLNPITATFSYSRQITDIIHLNLLQFSPTTLELAPQLAKSRPQIKEITEGPLKGGVAYTFELFDEARWDNGEPVSAKDFIFSMKAIFNPLVRAQPVRSFLNFMRDIRVDPQNPRKFTIFTNQKYILGEAAVSNTYVIPEYIFDPEHLMKAYSIKDLLNPEKAAALKEEANIQEFADAFNSARYAREKEFVVGCGPYELVDWQSGQQIVLKKKENWWGDALAEKFEMLRAVPSELVFLPIKDQTTAAIALRDEKYDVTSQLDAKTFLDFKKDSRISGIYNFYLQPSVAYDFIYINAKLPKLADKRVRRALAHLLNVKEIIEKGRQGLAQVMVGPVNPELEYFNKDLKPIEFNVQQAKGLLAEAGWKDFDNNGIVDKIIDGKRVEMNLTLLIAAGSSLSQTIGLLFKNGAKKGGVNIELQEMEGRAKLSEIKARNYELATGSFVSYPNLLDDFEQLYHTSSDNPNGFNRTGFGNAESDALIEEIKITLDEEKRNDLYRQFQEILYDEQPQLFIDLPQERIAIHKKFDAKPSALKPGYHVPHFKLNQK